MRWLPGCSAETTRSRKSRVGRPAAAAHEMPAALRASAASGPGRPASRTCGMATPFSSAVVDCRSRSWSASASRRASTCGCTRPTWAASVSSTSTFACAGSAGRTSSGVSRLEIVMPKRHPAARVPPGNGRQRRTKRRLRKGASCTSHGPRPAARLGSYALAGGLVGAAGFVAAGLMALLPLADPGMVFLAAVLLTAVLAGLGPSILAAVLGLLVYDFLFVDPRFTLTVAKPQDILSMFMFLVVAVLTSELTARVRDQAEAARRREERTAALYAFAREIAGSADLDDLVRVILDHVARLFGTRAALLLPDPGRLVLRAIRPPGTALAETERAT